MDLYHFNEKKENKVDINRIHEGVKTLPDLKTAILANLKGYINGSYPAPLDREAEKFGYYPLSSATDKELEDIERIENIVLKGK